MRRWTLQPGPRSAFVTSGVSFVSPFDTCRDFLRTVPVLQHDRDKPEDLDTATEDHIFPMPTG